MASPDPLDVRVLKAVEATVATLTPVAWVPAAQIYRRVVLAFTPGRDLAPAVLIAPTPGRAEERRKTLSKLEVVFPVTVVLVAAADQLPLTADPKKPGDPEWRTVWRQDVTAAFHGPPPDGWPAEVKRVFPDPDTVIDGSQFERANLWWSAVPIRVLTRQAL